jgi:hypothetical protein
MELKLEKKTYPVFKETTVIPESMRHIQQAGYTAPYKEGSFGHILMQEKHIGMWNLYLYYIEVLHPFEFYISSPHGCVPPSGQWIATPLCGLMTAQIK